MSQGRPTAAQQEAARGTWVMGTPVPPYGPPPAGWSVADYGFPASGAPPPSYSASNNRAGNPYLDISAAPIGAQAGGNPYVNVSPVPNKSVLISDQNLLLKTSLLGFSFSILFSFHFIFFLLVLRLRPYGDDTEGAWTMWEEIGRYLKEGWWRSWTCLATPYVSGSCYQYAFC